MSFELNKKLAEAFDTWRVVPRALVVGYCWMLVQVSQWFMALPDPTSAQAAFVSTIVGAAAAIFGLYTNSGKKRD